MGTKRSNATIVPVIEKTSVSVFHVDKVKDVFNDPWVLNLAQRQESFKSKWLFDYRRWNMNALIIFRLKYCRKIRLGLMETGEFQKRKPVIEIFITIRVNFVIRRIYLPWHSRFLIGDKKKWEVIKKAVATIKWPVIAIWSPLALKKCYYSGLLKLFSSWKIYCTIFSSNGPQFPAAHDPLWEKKRFLTFSKVKYLLFS